MVHVVLGLSAFFHDSAAALIVDGKVIAAAQEERFTRIKNDASFPTNAIKYVLQEANIDAAHISNVAYYEKPLLKFERLLETYHAFAPKGFVSFLKAMPLWLNDKLFLRKRIKQQLTGLGFSNVTLYFPEHHLSHAASAFFPSPFEKATILTIDGVGEWATLTMGIGEGNTIKILKEQHFPHSVGLVYSSFTYYLGFRVNSGEYKVMGLAAYGDPDAEETKKFIELIKEELVDIREDGSILLNMDYFKYATALTMTNDKRWEALFKITRRKPQDALHQGHANLSFALQKVVEEIVLKLGETAINLTRIPNLVMAGGVALNSVANGKLLKSSFIKNLWIQPAAGDAGGALGAAWAAWHIGENQKRKVQHPDTMKGCYLGPSYANSDIVKNSATFPGMIHKIYDNEHELLEMVTNVLVEGKIVGWFQGRMEFGPRALGNRSILADPRNPKIQGQINQEIKFRESFRPFAPSVLLEDVHEYFDLDEPSPYMLLVRPLNKKISNKSIDDRTISFPERLSQQRSDFPAITHVDNSARIQSVDKRTNPLFWKLLKKFKEKTGHGMLVNTSFNIKDEPIVCNPSDALRCFLNSGMDVLVMGNTVYDKELNSKMPTKNNN